MKSIFLMTVSGPEQGDTLRELAKKTRGLGGEWLVSKAITHDGHLAAIMRVTIESDREQSLKETLIKEFPLLRFNYDQPVEGSTSFKHTLTVEIDSLDRPGLTRDIQEALQEAGAQMEYLESSRHPLGAVSSTLYSTRVNLSVTEETALENLVRALEALSTDIVVKITD